MGFFDVIKISFELTVIVVGVALFFIYAPRYSSPEVVQDFTPQVKDFEAAKMIDGPEKGGEQLPVLEAFDPKVMELEAEPALDNDAAKAVAVLDEVEEQLTLYPVGEESEPADNSVAKAADTPDEVEDQPAGLEADLVPEIVYAELAKEFAIAVKLFEPYTISFLDPPSLLPPMPPVLTVNDVTFDLFKLKAQSEHTAKIFERRRALIEEGKLDSSRDDEKSKRARDLATSRRRR